MTTTTITQPFASVYQLPEIVEHYLERALPSVGSAPKAVRITQRGHMKSKADGRELPFTAVEELLPAEVGFTWRAKIRVAPLVSMRVVDSYVGGKGFLDGRLFGLPVTRGRGADLNEGQAMRYLAELPWVPHALTANRGLEWRQLEDDVVEVTAPVGSAKVAVGLRFDRNGDILAAFAHRPHREGKGFATRNWVGIYSDYAEVGGIRIPTHAEVHWELQDGPFVYWRATVTGLETL